MVASYGLRVAGYALRVTRCALRVARYGLRVARCELRVFIKTETILFVPRNPQLATRNITLDDFETNK